MTCAPTLVSVRIRQRHALRNLLGRLAGLTSQALDLSTAIDGLPHWRTHDGDEVDIVVEFDDGRVVAFEVKAAERIQGQDFTSLRKRRDALGDRFIAGVALSTGRRSYTCEQKLHVMPIDRLWTTVV